MHKLLALLVLSMPLVATDALAQDIQDLDSPSSGAKKKKKKGKSAAGDVEVLREIERGYYVKSGVGGGAFVLNYGSVLRAGNTVSIAGGNDFVDTESKSIGWELAFQTGVYNGMHYENQRDAFGAVLIQGDIRTFSLLGNVEYSIYPGRRIGIGFRAGGGVMFTPLLMHKDQVAAGGDFAGEPMVAVHETPHPLGFGGPTFEYHTKLSHFSVGLDVDVTYAVGFDLGVGGQGYLKYAF